MAEVWEYRRQVRAVVDQVIDDAAPDAAHRLGLARSGSILMGIEHERIHLETSSVLIRQLPLELVRPASRLARLRRSRRAAPANELLDVPGGTVVLGKDRDHPLYGWDNEYGRLETGGRRRSGPRATWSATASSARSSTPAATATERWWTEEGWGWRTYQQAEHPRFWVPGDGGQLAPALHGRRRSPCPGTGRWR